MQEYTFLWHDYETFGVQPRRDRPAQFAAIRTDAQLNEIGDPIMIYCQPAPDFLPDPQSCLITGITPQICLDRGLPENEFAGLIEQAFSQNGTIGVGYNTIRFDDEITRFLFWRNLIDPYAREWQNNCGRWDILDVVRTAYALRPEGINWPTNDEGKPSFRLEHLASANNLTHDSAHDALSDVRATIALARLIRERQPKLFDFCLSLHKKEKVLSEIGLPIKRAFLHVSGMIPAERGCITAVWPLATHPHNKNEVLVWDLNYDPTELFSLDAASIQFRMFTKTDELPEGVKRLPIKSIHLNKSPIVISNLKTLRNDQAIRWNLDMKLVQSHIESAQSGPDMSAIWEQIFKQVANTQVDVDEDLYGGFIGKNDRHLLDDLRFMNSAQLQAVQPQFNDQRLKELFFRYKARNFPQCLSIQEKDLWEKHRILRLLDGASKAFTVEQFFDRIDVLSESANDKDEEILGALYDYAEQIIPTR
jgi:exodeoxyribonuclease-1